MRHIMGVLAPHAGCAEWLDYEGRILLHMGEAEFEVQAWGQTALLLPAANESARLIEAMAIGNGPVQRLHKAPLDEATLDAAAAHAVALGDFMKGDLQDGVDLLDAGDVAGGANLILDKQFSRLSCEFIRVVLQAKAHPRLAELERVLADTDEFAEGLRAGFPAKAEDHRLLAAYAHVVDPTAWWVHGQQG